MSDGPAWFEVSYLLPVTIRVLAEDEKAAKYQAARVSFRAIGVPHNEYSISFPIEQHVKEQRRRTRAEAE